MSKKTITLSEDNLKETIRTALRMGANAGGVKHKKLVEAVFEEVVEKEATDLNSITQTVVLNIHEFGPSSYERSASQVYDFNSIHEMRRRKAAYEAVMAEIKLNEMTKPKECYPILPSVIADIARERRHEAILWEAEDALGIPHDSDEWDILSSLTAEQIVTARLVPPA